jgi:hypothetical protein
MPPFPLLTGPAQEMDNGPLSLSSLLTRTSQKARWPSLSPGRDPTTTIVGHVPAARSLPTGPTTTASLHPPTPPDALPYPDDG